ncbi:hypothetical protein RKE29_11000 [Streptomyces sp. B1866]|uniref:hypothetical protein n=1 Tax=Streptomyces sp. B1866 TaxID=3075431 RepID=UPI00288CDC68|nr:hypothetical protein [Streptomyces sp. B1866]MDT3397166.1 hypothetical protein [Streptomyces sp. B1866]
MTDPAEPLPAAPPEPPAPVSGVPTDPPGALEAELPPGEPPEASAGALPEAPAGVPGPAAPAPLGVPRTPTGVAEVDDRLDRLADTDHLPVGDHLAVYEDVHGGLRDALAALDRQPGPPAPPRTSPAGPHHPAGPARPADPARPAPPRR